jgi:threonine/homoserine/homoserine lactone efflux protein
MFLMSHAIRKGWRKTLPAAFSPLITDGPAALLIVTILSQVPARLIMYLRIFGEVLILYLAYEAWKSWCDFHSEEAATVETGTNSFLKTALIN